MKLTLFIALFFSLISTASVVGQKLEPKVEVGMIAGAFWLPYYPGSDESKYNFLSLPYFIYRGEIFKSDREGGARASLFTSKMHTLDLSFGASFPTESDETVARKGMPDLDWLFEFGPRYSYLILKNKKQQLMFNIPLRFVYATDFQRVSDQGFTIQPDFNYKHFGLMNQNLTLSARLGVYLSDKRTNQYFYDVEPEYVTATRTAFVSKSGFGGAFLRLSSEYFFSRNVTMLFSISNNYYSGSVNAKSPLVNSLETTSYTLGLIWRFWESEQRAGKPSSITREFKKSKTLN